MKITIGKSTHISEAPHEIVEKVRAQLTFRNPIWLENQRMGRWQGNTPRYFQCYGTDGQGGLNVPRGFTGQLLRMCHEVGELPELIDETRVLDPVKIDFHGRLRPFQEQAVADIYSSATAPWMHLQVLCRRKITSTRL